MKTSLKRSYSVIENERFGLVFAKTVSIISGTVVFDAALDPAVADILADACSLHGLPAVASVPTVDSVPAIADVHSVTGVPATVGVLALSCVFPVASIPLLQAMLLASLLMTWSSAVLQLVASLLLMAIPTVAWRPFC